MPLRCLAAHIELAKPGREQEAVRAHEIGEAVLPAFIEQDISPEV